MTESCCEIKDPKSLALYWVVRLADMPQTVAQAVAEGARLDFQHPDDWTLLLTALWYEKFENAKALIGLGADIHFVNEHNNTALSLAAQKGNEELVRILLDLGADKKHQDADGDTALDCALAFGHEHLRELLS